MSLDDWRDGFSEGYDEALRDGGGKIGWGIPLGMFFFGAVIGYLTAWLI